MWRLLLTAVATLVFALCPCTCAAAANPAALAEVEKKAAEARKQYQAGDFERAVALYLEAYRIAPAGALLYNIAHVYDRKLDEPDLAIDFYRRYIAAPDADPTAVERATRRVSELKAKQEAARRAEIERMRAPPPAPPPVAPTPVPAVSATAQPEDPGASQRLAGWIAVGGGAALLGAAVGLGVAAQQKSDDFSASVALDQKKDFRDQGETMALSADVLYAVGGVAAVTGVVLLLTAPDAEPAAVSLGPTPDGAGAALGLGGRW